MAKMINNLLIKVYQRILIHIEDKAKFKKDYAEVVIARRKSRTEKRVNNLKDSLNQEILAKALKYGINNDLTETFISEKIKKIEERFYWKKRALKASFSRKKEKAQDKTILEKAFNEKSLVLDNELNQEINDLRAKYANNIDNQEQYSLEVKTLEIRTTDKIKEIERKSVDNLEDYQEKTGNKLKRLEKQASFFRDKLFSLADNANIKDYGLEEGVILKLDNLTMRFGGLVAVDHLSFDVKEGEIFGLIGPNGAGKTTVFNCITKFYKPSEGKMYFRKNKIDTVFLNEYKVHQIIKQGIVRTFQNVELIWELSVIDNLLVAAHTLFKTGFFGQLLHTRKLHQEELVLRKKAENVLLKMGLFAYKDSYPLGLPYGILKKIELARTLMVEPKMIILDEPAAGLNDAETLELAKIIKMIRDEEKVTIFLVEHDMGLVMDICDTVCAISFGKKLAIGTPKEIQENKLVRDAYLGEE
ncbi:MAG: ABC transporter ATP-binding protein [Candidatus Izemoplasmatales bacterium]|jgi:branched-chain amino acid transport system ATP-binding protein|nr:ABC transporter ATP-binding protein [Candidatus Izemoplasmatales bacterium]